MEQSHNKKREKKISSRDMGQELQQLGESQRQILDNSPAAMLITRFDGSIIYANPRFIEQYGVNLNGTTQKITDFYEDPKQRQFVIKAIRSKGHLEDYELHARKADGSLIWVLFSAQAFQFEEEKVILTSLFDITKHKKLEDELRESEARYSKMSSAAYEGIAIVEEGRIIDANPQLAIMLGHKPGKMVGLSAMDFVAPESRELVAANMRAGIEGPYEHMALKKDGTIFPVEIRARSIPYQGRQVRVSVIRDITERIQAEENLKLQAERLRILNSIEQAILSSKDLSMILEMLVGEIARQLHVDAVDVLLFDSQAGTLDFASGKGFRTKALRYTRLPLGYGLAGLAAQEHRTIHVFDLSKLENNPSLLHAISNEKFITYYAIPLIANRELHGVLEVFHRSPLAPDPDWLALLDTLAGQAAISINHARLLEETQQGLKETNALYLTSQGLAASSDPQKLMHDLVNHLHDNFGYYYVQIYVRDPETGDFQLRAGSGSTGEELIRRGHRLAAGEGIIGYTAETGLPFYTNDVDNVIFFKPNPLLPEIKSELTVPIKTAEHVLGHLDVQQVPPAQLTQRDLRLVSAVAEQLAVALQKARLYADLQDSLRHEKETRAQLIHSEKLAVAGRLLASVSHELNNPLQAIQNALFLLQEEKGISEQGRQDLKIVLAEAERMGTMLARLRTTYQPVRKTELQPVQINDIVADVHTLVATHMRHANITYEFEPGRSLPHIPGMPDQLRQVVLNLFMNAVDAMPGGGRLLVTTKHLPENNEVLISITDNGSGIDPVILPHIFEPFTTNKEQGTGLGLAITYEIVFNHGGRIQAENNPDGGSIFHVWLPVGTGD